jgi:voltage-gated sodium channel
MTLRARCLALSEAGWFRRSVIALIVVNAVTLGLETWPAVTATAGGLLSFIDRVIVAIFVAEIAVRIVAHGWRYFRDPWGLFDFAIVSIALVPATEWLSVLRALRILRALRLISAVPRMRAVVHALLSAIPGLSSIIALLLLIFYVAAVMATKLFGETFPDWFGSLGDSFYSLFQIMTLESWSMGIVRPVMEVHPLAWAFFVPFILVATYTMLNLFIAVVVNAMQSEYEAERSAEANAAHDERDAILHELQALRAEVKELRTALDRR